MLMALWRNSAAVAGTVTKSHSSTAGVRRDWQYRLMNLSENTASGIEVVVQDTVSVGLHQLELS